MYKSRCGSAMLGAKNFMVTGGTISLAVHFVGQGTRTPSPPGWEATSSVTLFRIVNVSPWRAAVNPRAQTLTSRPSTVASATRRWNDQPQGLLFFNFGHVRTR